MRIKFGLTINLIFASTCHMPHAILSVRSAMKPHQFACYRHHVHICLMLVLIQLLFYDIVFIYIDNRQFVQWVTKFGAQ